MKARVIATGDIIEISEDCSYLYAEYYDKSYNLNELEFLDVKENSFPKDIPDYWSRIEHQAAIAAMQGMVSNSEMFIELGNVKGLSVENAIAEASIKVARALVEKMKKKEE